MKLTTSHHIIQASCEYHKGPRILTDSLDKQTQLKKTDIGFGTSNVRRLHTEDLLMTVIKDISKYKLASVGAEV
jgi:hypothetical protein